MRMNLTPKIILILAVLLIPVFAVVGWILQSVYEKQTYTNAEQSIKVIMHEHCQAIQDYLSQREQLGPLSVKFIIEKLKHEPTPEELQNFDRRYRIINGALRTDVNAFPNSDISAIFLSNISNLDDRTKRIILATEGCFDDYAKGVKSKVFNMYLITKQQLIRIYEKDWSLEIEPDHDFTKDSFYYIADPAHNPQRTPQWAEVYYDSIWKHWMTSLITPIYIGDEFIGIIGHDVILDDIYNDIIHEKYFDTGYGFVFDSRKNLVVHSKSLCEHNETAKMGEKLQCQSFNETTDKIISKIIQQQGCAGLVPIKDFENDGRTFYIFAQKLGFLDWYYAMAIPEDEVFKYLPEFRAKFIFAAAGVSFLIFAAIIAVMWCNVIRPVIKISKATRELGRGNLDYRIDDKGKDELGRLAQAFNKMADDIRQSMASIEELNSEIAERKKAEERISRAKQDLQISIDSMPFGVMVVGKDKIIRRVNTTVLKMTGYQKYDELVGKVCHYLVCRSEYGNCPVLDKKQKVDEAERIMLSKDGKEIPILKSIVPVTLDNEEVLLETFVDITSLKAAEQKLKELNNQFLSANQKLEQVNQELKNFVYIASHDLREPVRKIMSFGRMLLDSLADKLTADDAENFNYMIQGADRMGKMIEGLLAYSKINTKDQQIENVDLNEIVEQLKQFELSVPLEEKHVIVEIPQQLPVVKGDAVHIRQLMQNLIANGIKYQSKGNVPHIRITAAEGTDDGMARIEISDNGIGIKPEYQQVVFAMFKRLHSRSEYEGTGIGLAVCRKIVERHGGQIGVESEFGKGSTFWFTIPLAANTAMVCV